MKRIFLLSVMVAGSCFGGIFDWLDTSSARTKRIRQQMQDLEPEILKSLNDFQVHGISIGIVSEGQLVYAKGFGWRDAEQRLPATAQTVYPIGSCTKAFTSFLAGMLVDEGLIRWDERLIDIYPEFRLWDSHASLNLTMRDLLAHRTGLPQHDLMWYNSSSLTRNDLMARLRFLPPSCDIRERYQYNNLMYLVAGVAMEKLTALSWEQLVGEKILKPLAMTRTTARISDMQKDSDFAVPYIEKNEQLKRMAFRDISLIAPAGGLNSNVQDLAKWMQLHLNHGYIGEKPLIGASVLQEMHAPQSIMNGAPETNETLIITAGLGWNIMSYRGHYYVSHDGGLDGFTSVVGLFPRDDFGIVILSNKNLTTLPRYLSMMIADKILDLPAVDWLGQGVSSLEKTRVAQREALKLEDLSRKKGTNPSHPLEAYLGEYVHEGYGTIEVCKNEEGGLVMRLNELECALDHWHYDVFVISEEFQDMFRSREGLKLNFQNGLNGEVERLVVPFEPKSGDLVFQKKPSGTLTQSSYLKQFVGVYEIYGYLVEIGLSKGTLYAQISGQPPYELVPELKNEFSVKALAGYNVRFILDQNENVSEVLLLQPYGAFSAKRVK